MVLDRLAALLVLGGGLEYGNELINLLIAFLRAQIARLRQCKQSQRRQGLVKFLHRPLIQPPAVNSGCQFRTEWYVIF